MPWKETAIYAPIGECGEAIALINSTEPNEWILCENPLLFLAICSMQKHENAVINMPLKGILAACKIPPKADSINAHIPV